MIGLAGYEPEVDIAIELIGPRPGEKLREELLGHNERSQATTAERIVRAVRQRPLEHERIERALTRIEELIAVGDEAGLAEQLIAVVGPRAEELTGAGGAEGGFENLQA
jgi:FlaA1/EpsC-like NDP-sugar epimerase